MALLMGPAMAATFYEPVYVLMNRWFEAAERPRAYAVLTVLSGFSVVIFTPLTRFLVDEVEWDGAVLILAGGLLLIGCVVPLALKEPAAVERGRVSVVGLSRETLGGWRYASPSFWWFSAAFFLASVASSGYSFHLLSQLETRGFDEGAVASAIAVTGFVSLPARFLLPFLSGRTPSAALLAACFVMLGIAAWVAAMAELWWHVWLYVGVYGAAYGAIYPLRGLVTSERFGGPYFGRLIGIQALLAAAARAAGPIAISAIGTDSDSYRIGFMLAGLLLLVAAAGTFWSMSASRAHTVGATT
jgi:MFS family permease